MQRIIDAFNWAVNYLISVAPKDTGNLAYNAIKYKIQGNTMTIFIDENIAPYMVYTNEPWNARSANNPNEKWFDNAVQEILRYMAIYLGGEIRGK